AKAIWPVWSPRITAAATGKGGNLLRRQYQLANITRIGDVQIAGAIEGEPPGKLEPGVRAGPIAERTGIGLAGDGGDDAGRDDDLADGTTVVIDVEVAGVVGNALGICKTGGRAFAIHGAGFSRRTGQRRHLSARQLNLTNRMVVELGDE